MLRGLVLVAILLFTQAAEAAISSLSSMASRNTWYEVANSTAKTVWNAHTPPIPSGSETVYASGGVYNYSGGVYDQTRHRLVLMGGGHGGYFGNEVYFLDLDELDQGLRVWWWADPVYRTVGDFPLPYSDTGIGLAGANQGKVVPISRHMGGMITHDTARDDYFLLGYAAAPASGGVTHPFLFHADDTTGYPWELAAPMDSFAMDFSTFAYDAANDSIWGIAKSGLYEISPSASYARTKRITWSRSWVYNTSALDPTRHWLVWIESGTTSVLRYVDLDNTAAGAQTPTLTGDLNLGLYPRQCSLIWYAPRGKFLLFNNKENRGAGWVDGDHELYSIDPATWIIEKVETDGDTALPSGYTSGVYPNMAQGPYKRFAYDADNNVLVLAAGWNQSIYLCRLDDSPVEVSLSVTEPSGLARTAWPITSGVPIPKHMQTTDWSLWDGETEIPIQKTVLTGPTTDWLLLDFQATLTASESHYYVLRGSAASATHADALVVADDGTTLTVTTGPLKATIGKTSFNLLETVWYDANDDGVYAEGERVVLPSGTNNLVVTNAEDSQIYVGNGTPDAIAWEDTGSLRATLKVDGHYAYGGSTLLYYTTRITFWAGRSDVKIEHVLRNSREANKHVAKLTTATLRTGTGATALANVWPGAFPVWSDAQNVTLEILPTSVYHNAAVSRATNGGMVIPDLSHFGATAWLEFEPGLSAGEQANRTTIATAPIMALAADEWYAANGDLSQEPASLTDERAAYAQWGWSYTASQIPTDAAKPTYKTDATNWDVHNDTESDDLWQDLTMYWRTGSRGYYDRARSWARYFKREYAYRTDGWLYDWQTGNSTDNPTLKDPRTEQVNTALTTADNTHLTDFNAGKVDFRTWAPGCHIYGWGLVDWYYMTGDRDALAAATDIAEITDYQYTWQLPGSRSMNTYEQRASRQLLGLLRVYEATGAAKWLTAADNYAGLWMNSPDWDTRGFYWNNYYGGGIKITATWQATILNHGLYRYWRRTGLESVRQRILAQAAWFLENRTHAGTNYTGSRIWIDTPTSGTQSHNYWYPTLSGFGPQPTYAFADLFVIAYRLGGGSAYLTTAKDCWNYGSKTAYGLPITKTVADNAVARFANGSIGVDTFLYGGDMPYASMLFRPGTPIIVATDTTAPAVVADLAASSPTTSGFTAAFTAPGDDGPTGTATSYDVRCLTPGTLSEVAWAAASQTTGEPAPSVAGTTESFAVGGLDAGLTYSCGVKASDEVGNTGQLSNVVSVTTTGVVVPGTARTVSTGGARTLPLGGSRSVTR